MLVHAFDQGSAVTQTLATEAADARVIAAAIELARFDARQEAAGAYATHMTQVILSEPMSQLQDAVRSYKANPLDAAAAAALVRAACLVSDEDQQCMAAPGEYVPGVDASGNEIADTQMDELNAAVAACLRAS
jgi:hypothetical protein